MFKFQGGDDDDAVAGAANTVINLESGDAENDEDHKIGVTGFIVDAAAKQGTMKATEVVENIADSAKETVETAWDATKNTARTSDAEAETNVVDTENLRGQLRDGHDNRIEVAWF